MKIGGGPDAGASPRLEVIEVIGRVSDRLFADYTYSATKTRTDILDIGQSISIITKEMIEDQGLMRLNDVTPFVAGANEFSVYNDITIRGFRNYDDRRVNGLRTYNNFWSQDVIAHVERVEVIKGPAAATFGDASPGGVVNIVTKKPLEQRRHEVATRVGSFDDRYVALDTTGPLTDDLLYRLNVAREDSESFRDQQFNENTIVAPSVTYQPFARTRINVDYVYIDSASVLDRGQPNLRGSQSLDEVPIEAALTQPGDRLDYESSSVTLSLDQQLTDTWSFGLAYNRYDYEEQLIEHRFDYYVTDSVVSLSYGDRDSDSDVESLSSYFTGEFETGALTHRLVFGVDYVDREDFSRQIGTRDAAFVDLNAIVNVRRDVGAYTLTEPSWSPYGGTLENTGIYLQDQISFGQWELMLGLRHDDFEVETYESAAGGPSISGASDEQVSPRVSVVRRLSPRRSLYASWITGFEPPPTYANAPQFGGPFDPQDSELFEVGYKHVLFDGRALLTTSVYELTKKNPVVYANDSANPDLYVQRGEERARGFEFELTGNVTEALTVAANYAYNDAKITEDPDPAVEGSRKEGAPRHAGTLWARYQLSPSWGFGAGVQYVDERATFVDTLQLPSYTLWSAAMYWDPTDKLSLSLQGRNLTDDKHWTGGYNYQRLYPGDPRSYSLRASYTF